MSQSIISKVCNKYYQYLRMEDLKLPGFLNTPEKYNELVWKLIPWKIWKNMKNMKNYEIKICPKAQQGVRADNNAS